MEKGDLCLFYHSVEEPIGVAGIAKVVKKFEEDPTQFDKNDEHFDPKATKDKPIWFCPTLQFVEKFDPLLTRDKLKNEEKLKGMILLQKSTRLSIIPVKEEEFKVILSLAAKR